MNNIKYYLDRVQNIFEKENFLAEPRELYEPINYTLRLGGKRIRPTLLLSANSARSIRPHPPPRRQTHTATPSPRRQPDVWRENRRRAPCGPRHRDVP